MSTVTFVNGTQSVTVDAPAVREWRDAAGGQAGTAAIRLPRSSPAASATYVDPEGGSLVRIADHGGCGAWLGVVTEIDFAGDAVLVSAVQPWALLGQRSVQRPGTLTDILPGHVADLVLRDALAGVRTLWTRGQDWGHGSPALPSVTLAGDAWSLLRSLMDASDGELAVLATGEVTWCDPAVHAPRYDPLLIAGSTLLDVAYRLVTSGRVSEVLASSGRQRYVAQRGEVAAGGWPAQATLSVDDPRQLVATAERELEARSRPAVVISGAVTSAHWAIRERMRVQVLVPHAGFSGRMHWCRVLGRRLDDERGLLELDLQALIPSLGTLAAATRMSQRPATRTSANAEGGSFAQQFRQLRRLVTGNG